MEGRDEKMGNTGNGFNFSLSKLTHRAKSKGKSKFFLEKLLLWMKMMIVSRSL